MSRKSFVLFLALAAAVVAHAQWLPILSAGVSTSSNTPVFVKDAGSNLGPTGSTSTTVITLTGAIAQNDQVTVVFTWSGAGQTLTSVTDNKGNTYAVLQTQPATVGGVAVTTVIATAKAATALAVSDTVTLNWGSAAFGYRFGRVFDTGSVQGSGQPDQSAKATGTGTAPSAAASTTAAKTSAVGLVLCANATYTVGSGWTISGTPDFIDSTFRCNYVYGDFASAGSKDPAGTLNASNTWIVVWAAYK